MWIKLHKYIAHGNYVSLRSKSWREELEKKWGKKLGRVSTESWEQAE